MQTFEKLKLDQVLGVNTNIVNVWVIQEEEEVEAVIIISTEPSVIARWLEVIRQANDLRNIKILSPKPGSSFRQILRLLCSGNQAIMECIKISQICSTAEWINWNR